MTTEAPRPVDFTKAVPEFTTRYPMEMGLLRLVGAYPGQVVEGRTNPYTEQEDTEYYGNIGEHCIAVALCADILTDNILGANNPLKKSIVQRALVHDVGKPLEVMRRKAVSLGLIDDAYSRSAYLSVRGKIALQADVSPELAEYIAHAGEETGHLSFPSFIEVQDGQLRLKTEGNMPEMIVHHADDMTYTPIVEAGQTTETYYVTVSEKQTLMDYPKRYGFLYTKGLGFDSNGNIIDVPDMSHADPTLQHVKSLADWHLWIADEIAKHITSHIDPEVPPQYAQQYLKNLVNTNLPPR